jgi:hypothetical protein
VTLAGRAAAFALAGLYWAPAALGSLVQAELVVSGETVSARTRSQLGFFALDTKRDQPALTCAFGQVCSVPAGRYAMDIVSDDLILVRRPKMQSDPPEVGELIHRIRLEAIQSAWVVANLPKQTGYRLDLVDLSSGAVFHRIFGPETTRLKVPARALIGALRDGSRHMGLFRLSPKPGEIVLLEPPASPAKSQGQLLCSFVFPEPSKSGGYSHLLPTLLLGEKEVPPDILVTGDLWHVWAVWLSGPAGPFKVMTHDSTWIPQSSVQGEIPDRGTLSLQRIAMIHKPSLSSTLTTSERLGVTPVEMRLFDCAAVAGSGWPIRLKACTPVATAAGETGSPVLFEHLTPSFFALQWHASHFRGTRVIDMRDGRSRSDAFAPEILHISGNVKRGDEPLSTPLRFVDTVLETEYEAMSDESGKYEVFVCPRSVYVVSAHLEGQGEYTKALEILKDIVYDVVLPRNAAVIQVSDGETGAPVPNAGVTFTLHADKNSTGGVGTSDENGRATLPPLQPGVLTYRAAAKGYAESTDQVSNIKDSTRAELVVLLKSNLNVTIQIREADGTTPAVGAIASWRDGYISAPADADGVVNVDGTVGEGAGIAVVNRRGEVSVFRWQREGDNVFTMQLPGPLIRLRFDTAGKPVRYQLPRYALGGIVIPHPLDMQARLRGGGDANSRRDGMLIVPGLPGSGLLTLWPALHPELSVTVSLPVNDIVRLQAVEYAKTP